MSFITKLFKASDNRDEEISKIVPLSACSHDCDSCSTKYPGSVKIDDADIYNSAKQTDIHFIVPTGKSDWAHDATSTSNTVENALVRWKDSKEAKEFIPGGKIKVATSSIPIDISNPKALKGEVNDVLILPYFVWVKRVDHTQVAEVLNELIPLLIKAREEGATEVPKEIHGITVEPSTAWSYIFLCSHRTRDKRCGITAPLMKKEMDFRLRDTGHYRDHGDERPNGVHVTYINHVGGHKFAANVIIYIRSGEIIWLAKCTPTNAQPIIDETVLGGGKVWSDLVRVVQKEKSVEW